MKILLLVLVAFGAFVVFVAYRFRRLVIQSRTMSPPPGVVGGKLTVCASPMRCVNSDESSEANIASLSISVRGDEAQRRVEVALVKIGGSVRTRQPGYLHAEFQSKLFGFVDDVEIRFCEGGAAVRSSSRVGKSDLGANKKRVEQLRAALAESAR